MKVEIHPLTPDRFDDVAALFGPNGACAGCWCMYFRISAAQWKTRDKDNNKRAFRARVRKGPPPGLLAYEDDRAVGWVQVGPRADVPRFNSSRAPSAPIETGNLDGTWAVSCFFIHRSARGSDLMAWLLDASVRHARKGGARTIDACPWDTALRKPGSAAPLYVGTLPTFAAAGFEEIARRAPHRPLVRKILRPRS